MTSRNTVSFVMLTSSACASNSRPRATISLWYRTAWSPDPSLACALSVTPPASSAPASSVTHAWLAIGSAQRTHPAAHGRRIPNSLSSRHPGVTDL
eukprot:598966-Rhodomonas_salina.1